MNLKLEYSLKDHVFSKKYREMVRLVKKSIKEDQKLEAKIDDIRASQGTGKQGPASRPPAVPKSGYSRRNSRKKSGQTDNKAQDNSDAGTIVTPTEEV
jgi:hypothetical protein